MKEKRDLVKSKQLNRRLSLSSIFYEKEKITFETQVKLVVIACFNAKKNTMKIILQTRDF
jgi:hypothetical protein